MVKREKLKVSLCGIEMDNPVMAASGTFGYGHEFAEFYDINILGGFSFKGTTLKARFGNPTPRIADCTAGLINSVGLQNPGAEAVVSEELQKLRSVYSKKVMANISGGSAEEYAKVCEILEAADEIGWYEVNISCPNVKNGGMAFGTDPHDAAAITEAVRKQTKKPVIMKLSPNVTDITEIARACESAGADGLTLINTLLGMRIDIKTGRPVIANRMGGFSGPAVFPAALRMVYQTYEAVKIPIVGCGGISSAEDVIEMMMAGATAVQVGSANLVNPYACRDIINDLPQKLDKYGIDKISEITGGAH